MSPPSCTRHIANVSPDKTRSARLNSPEKDIHLMKSLPGILLLILALLASGCTASVPPTPATTTPAPIAATSAVSGADIPNLVGVWTGSAVGHINNYGFRSEGEPVYNITEQKGRAFAGYIEYSHYMGENRKNEEFSGVINVRNEIFIAQKEAGFTIGDLLGPDTLELGYVEEGDDAKAFLITLNRQK